MAECYLFAEVYSYTAEDTFKNSNTYRWTSIFEKALTPPPAPQVAPPHRPVTSISYATGNPCDMIRRWSKAHSPPPPHVAPPQIQKNAYHEWNLIFAIFGRAPADPSYPSAQIAPEGEVMSSNSFTTGGPHEEITKRPK